MNIERKEGFSQVCVWPGTLVGEENREDFVDFFKREMGVDVQLLEELKTSPDMENGSPVPETGGRNDVFFAVDGKDVGKFAIPRLSMGIKWIEDFIDNGGDELHPERIVEYRTW